MMEFTERSLEDIKLWLTDLINRRLTDAAILSGFLKYYVACDLNATDVRRDVLYFLFSSADDRYYAESEVRRVVDAVAESCQM